MIWSQFTQPRTKIFQLNTNIKIDTLKTINYPPNFKLIKKALKFYIIGIQETGLCDFWDWILYSLKGIINVRCFDLPQGQDFAWILSFHPDPFARLHLGFGRWDRHRRRWPIADRQGVDRTLQLGPRCLLGARVAIGALGTSFFFAPY